MSADLSLSTGVVDDGSTDKYAAKLKRVFGEVSRDFESLSKIISEVGKLDVAGNLKAQLSTAATTLQGLSKQFDALPKAMSDAMRSTANEARKGAQGIKGAMGEGLKGVDAVKAALDSALMLNHEVVQAKARKVQAVMKGHFDALGAFVPSAKPTDFLMLDPTVVQSKAKQVQAAVKGHYDALGVYQAEAAAKARATDFLMLDPTVVQSKAKQVQAAVKGHYDALGVYQAEAAAKARATDFLMLDPTVVQSKAKQVQAVMKGHYDALGVYQAEAAAKARATDFLMVNSTVVPPRLAARSPSPAGDYDSVMNTVRPTSELAEANRRLSDSSRSASGETTKLREEQKRLNALMREGHSAARGLAQGFGAMVFTYGSIVPLLAGAAVSNTIVGMVKEGASLERHLAFVSQLTDSASISVGAFAGAMQGAQVSVKEGAEGLRGLAQSGFNAEQALIALPSVLTLATVGELSVAQAALTATGIMHAFNLELGDIPHIVDVLTKSAAESNTSVASMMESLKTASLGADQFGVSIEEMSAALEIMGKRNITGSAAGTALKNLMAELASPTKDAAARMKELGFSAYDALGRLKPFEQQVGELRNKMANLGDEARNTVLTDLFNERGRRAAAALIKDFDDLEMRIERLRTGADGFAESVSQALGQTVSGQVKTLANDFQTILGGAFESTSDAWSNLVTELSAFVKSTAFKDSITVISTGVITLAQNIELVTVGIAAFLLRTQAKAVAMAALNAVVGQSIALELGLATATGTLSAAMGTLWAVMRAIAWPVAIVSSLAAAYYYLKGGVDESAEAQKRLLTASENLISAQAQTIRDSLDSARAFETAARTGRDYAAVLAEIKNQGKNNDATSAPRQKFDDAVNNFVKVQAALREGTADNVDLIKAQVAMRQAQTQLEKVNEVMGRGAAIQGVADSKAAEAAKLGEFNKTSKGVDALISDVALRMKVTTGYAGKAKELWLDLVSLQQQVREADPSDTEGVAKLNLQLDEARKRVQGMSSSVSSVTSGAEKLTDAQKMSAAGLKLFDDLLAKDNGYTASFAEDVTKLAWAYHHSAKSAEEYAEALAILQEQQPGAARARKQNQEGLDDLIKFIEEKEAAKEAAAEYIKTAQKQAARTLDGVGKGTAYRADQSGIYAIEDEFEKRRAALLKESQQEGRGSPWFAAQLQIAEELTADKLRIHLKGIADMRAAEKDWTNGASEAYENYLANIGNVAKSTENMFTKAFQGAEDALVKFVKTGKLDFASLADSIITDLIRIQIQQSIMPGLSAGIEAAGSWFMSLMFANGGAFQPGGIQAFANGGTFTNQIVNTPTLFKFAQGTGLMGEAGPEAIMPLTRGPNGKLGVEASGTGGGNTMVVNIIEAPGKGGTQSRRTENGVDILDVFVEKVKNSIAGDISRGSGVVPNAMSQTYGLNRVAGAY